MLPPWRRHLRIVLRPDRLLLRGLDRGLRRRTLAQASIPCEAGLPAWGAPLAALEEVLRQPLWQGAAATVFLSGHLVRYLVLPWDDAIVSPSEQIAYARHRFGQIYGQEAAADIRIAPQAAGRSLLASAVEPDLVAAIEAACRRHGIRLASLQPMLMPVFNHISRRLPKQASALAVVEPSQVCLCLFRDGDWLRIASHRTEDTQAEAVLQLLQRECLLAGLEPPYGPLFLYGPERTATAWPAGSAWQPRWIELSLAAGTGAGQSIQPAPA